MKYLKKGLLVGAFAFLAGCSTLQKPYDETDPNVQNQIRFVNFTAKLGCTYVVQEGTPQDVANTKKAVQYARSTLASDAPSYTAIRVIVDQFAPAKAKPYLDLALDEASQDFGEDIVDKKSVAFVAVDKIVEGCGSIVDKVQ